MTLPAIARVGPKPRQLAVSADLEHHADDPDRQARQVKRREPGRTRKRRRGLHGQ